MTEEAGRLIDRLKLAPHPEGGYFRETYRASFQLNAPSLSPHFTGARAASTAIYYLLTAGDRSRLHRIRSDEVWHFYQGDPSQVIELTTAGASPLPSAPAHSRRLPRRISFVPSPQSHRGSRRFRWIRA